MAKPISFFTRLGYGQFPYIIIREQVGMYRQIPIHFLKEELNTKEGIYVRVDSRDSHELIEIKCVDALREILIGTLEPLSHYTPESKWVFIGKSTKQGCVVLNPEQAIYVDSNGKKLNTSTGIPSGGTLLSVAGTTIIHSKRHFNYL